MAALAQGGRTTWRSPDGGTPLLVAAQNGHTAICCLLLACGSNVNEEDPDTGHTALHSAAYKGNKALVEVLLSRGATANKREVAGATPIYLACQQGHLDCVRTLLKAGACISLPINNGTMPIHVAAQNERKEIVKILLEHGCSPDMVSVCDCTSYQMNTGYSPCSLTSGHHLFFYLWLMEIWMGRLSYWQRGAVLLQGTMDIHR